MKQSLLTVLSLFILLNLAAGFVIFYQQEKLTLFQQTDSFLTSDNKRLTVLVKAAQETRPMIVTSNTQSSKNASVSAIINSSAKKVNGDLSIYYKNLTTNESVVINGDEKYYMASLYKIILTIYVLDLQKMGKIQFTDTIGSPPLTITKALDKVITESNNEYALALAQKFGWDTIETAMEEKLGIDFSFNASLQTNVKDLGFLFESIAKSLKISDDESSYLLKLLNNQTRLSKLPKYLPKNIISHNKTGELDNYSHDAAIFYTPEANYILIFMSKTPNPSSTNEQMALMSKDIYTVLNTND